MKLYIQWKDAPKRAAGRKDLRNMAIAELLKEEKLSMTTTMCYSFSFICRNSSPLKPHNREWNEIENDTYIE
jgi:hypothetical protein